MKSAGLGALVAAGMLACAGPAAASQWVATYKGHVNGGYDASGVFGTAGADLSGLAFTASFLYDTGIGFASPAPDGETADFAVLQATLTISDTTYDFGSGFANHIETHTGSLYPFGPGYVFHSVDTDFVIDASFYFLEQLILAGGAAAPGFLEQAVAETAIVNPGDGGPADYVGFFSIDNAFLGFSSSAYGDLRPESYSVSAVDSAVPEPGAWALMILGFGAAGSAVRRRRVPA